MSTVWFSVSEPRVYYRVPSDFVWSDEGISVTNFDLQMRAAPKESLEPYTVSKSVAFGGKDTPSNAVEDSDRDVEPPPKSSSDPEGSRDSERSFDNMGVLGVLGFLKGAVDEGLSMGEELLGQLDKEEAVALAKEVMDEALDVVSDFVDNEPVSEDTETETVTGFHLRSLFRQGLKDFRFSVQPREKTGTNEPEG